MKKQRVKTIINVITTAFEKLFVAAMALVIAGNDFWFAINPEKYPCIWDNTYTLGPFGRVLVVIGSVMVMVLGILLIIRAMDQFSDYYDHFVTRKFMDSDK